MGGSGGMEAVAGNGRQWLVYHVVGRGSRSQASTDPGSLTTIDEASTCATEAVIRAPIHRVAYLQAELTFAHAKLAGSSEGISVSPEYMTGKHWGMSSPSHNSPCGHHCPSNEPQSSHQSGSDKNTTFYNEQKGSCLPTPMNYSDSTPLSGTQQMNSTIQDQRESWEADTDHGGDLQALAFALLRRTRK